MTPEEMKLDMLVAELEYENRLLRARNERLEKEVGQQKQWVGLTDEERRQIGEPYFSSVNLSDVAYARAIEARLREKNQ